MKAEQYLIIGRTGIRGIRRTKPSLSWDELAIKIKLDIPDVLFQRPLLEATIQVDGDKIPSNQIHPDIILNTKELIEEQTGAKIDIRVVEYKTLEKEDGECQRCNGKGCEVCDARKLNLKENFEDAERN